MTTLEFERMQKGGYIRAGGGSGGDVKLDRVVRQVYEMLMEVRLGTIVAVWWDGGVSAHRDLGFRQRVLPNGSRETPVVTFIADGQVPSVAEIRERIKKGIGVAMAE